MRSIKSLSYHRSANRWSVERLSDHWWICWPTPTERWPQPSPKILVWVPRAWYGIDLMRFDVERIYRGFQKWAQTTSNNWGVGKRRQRWNRWYSGDDNEESIDKVRFCYTSTMYVWLMREFVVFKIALLKYIIIIIIIIILIRDDKNFKLTFVIFLNYV